VRIWYSVTGSWRYDVTPERTIVVTASSAVGARQYSPSLRSARWNRMLSCS
jgi:hypothetical protein